jgi:hypothetical protein
MKENERKRLIGSVLMAMDDVWKWVGARHGLQETAEIGAGFEGWYWTYSVTPSRVATMQ